MGKEIAWQINIEGYQSDNTRSECAQPVDDLIQHIKKVHLDRQEVSVIGVSSEEPDVISKIYVDAYIDPSDFYGVLSFLDVNVLTPKITQVSLSEKIVASIEFLLIF